MLQYRTGFVACVVALATAGCSKESGQPPYVYGDPPKPKPSLAPAPTPTQARPTNPSINPGCAECERGRVSCLKAVQAGQLPERSEQFADPAKAAKDGCAIDYMACVTDLGCPRR